MNWHNQKSQFTNPLRKNIHRSNISQSTQKFDSILDHREAKIHTTLHQISSNNYRENLPSPNWKSSQIRTHTHQNPPWKIQDEILNHPIQTRHMNHERVTRYSHINVGAPLYAAKMRRRDTRRLPYIPFWIIHHCRLDAGNAVNQYQYIP